MEEKSKKQHVKHQRGNKMEYITLYQKNKSYIDVVFDKNLDMELPRYTSAEAFRKALCELMGEDIHSPKAPRLLSDANSSSYKDRIAIMWGKTAYPEAVEVYGNVKPNEYGFCAVGNKIVIYGNTLEEIKTGAEALIAQLKENTYRDDNGNLIVRLPQSAKQRFSSEELAIFQLPMPKVGTSSILCDDGDDARMWVVEGCKTDDFDTYTAELDRIGFEIFSTNEIVNNFSKGDKVNRYATYTKDGIIADVWYTVDGYLYVTAGRGFDLPSKSVEAYEKVSETGLTIVGPARPVTRGETLLFFRLDDGSFFVIDGAGFDYMGDVLLAELEKQAPDPEHIVISCWLISHSHGDHTGAFTGLAKRMSELKDKVTVKSIMYNFAGYEQANVPRQSLANGDRNLRNIIDTVYPEARKYKVHPGNKFDFANMHVEVFNTPESSIKNQYPMPRNACNIAVKVTIEGQTIILMADTSAVDNETVGAVYGDYLKCDVLQPSHHGVQKGGIVSTNLLHAPETVLFMELWNEERMMKIVQLDFNQALINTDQNPNFKEFICHDDVVTYLPLPYTPCTKITMPHAAGFFDNDFLQTIKK